MSKLSLASLVCGVVVALLVSALCACHSSSSEIKAPVLNAAAEPVPGYMGGNATEPVPGSMDGNPAEYVLKATIFKMSGNYGDKVAVSLSTDGQLTYYPAPSDLTAESAPLYIADGWWLNRQGLGANSVFTKWTFDEYRNLKTAPTPAEIKAAVIPGSGVTDFRRLPIPASEALSLPAESLKKYL